MRPNPYPAFLELPSGKVIGKPTPVQGDEVPAFIVKTPAEVAAERAAKRARVEARAAAKAAKLERQKAAAAAAKQERQKAAAMAAKREQQKAKTAVIKEPDGLHTARPLRSQLPHDRTTVPPRPRVRQSPPVGQLGRFGDGHLCGCHSPRPTAGCTHC